MLFIKAKQFAKTTVLECAGSLVAGDEVATLKQAVLCTAARSVLVLDLGRIDKVDGAGLGVLAFLQGWSRSAGVRLKIADPSTRVRKLIDLTRLSSVLEIVPKSEIEEEPENASHTPICRVIAPAMIAAHR